MGGYVGPAPGSDDERLLSLMRPVGSIWQTIGSEDANDLFPGTWTKLAEGQFLVSAGDVSGDYNLGDTGGEAQHTLTVNEMPSHTHQLVRSATDLQTGAATRYHVGGGLDSNSGSTGGDQPHENRPPYRAVNTWERTA